MYFTIIFCITQLFIYIITNNSVYRCSFMKSFFSLFYLILLHVCLQNQFNIRLSHLHKICIEKLVITFKLSSYSLSRQFVFIPSSFKIWSSISLSSRIPDFSSFYSHSDSLYYEFEFELSICFKDIISLFWARPIIFNKLSLLSSHLPE